MDVLILNKSFDCVLVIDDYTSFIWTERFNRYGDFEIYSKVSIELLSSIKIGYYVYLRDSEKMMIIEQIKIETDIEDGSVMIISGRSLESLLERRIIWNQTILSGNINAGIKKLITENLINPTLTERAISNFVYEDTTDPKILGMSLEAQITGDNLYEAISTLCDTFGIGFKIELNAQNEFVFSLYSGINRSLNQEEVVPVIFSPDFENVLNSTSNYDIKDYRNVALVAGEDEDVGVSRRCVVIGDQTGLDRREIFVDARDIQSEDEYGETIPDEEYYAQLRERGEEYLNDCPFINNFEGGTESSYYTYGVDFKMGDIVHIEDQFGQMTQARIVELIRSKDTSGSRIYPSFVTYNEEE